MKDLEQIYEENLRNRYSPPPDDGVKRKIERIQGLFSSLKLGLQQLKFEIEQREQDDNGFSATIDQIDGAIETPFAIFDSTFYKNKERF
jgi:hypothetical protein